MTWDTQKPNTANTIAEIPAICQDNFDCIEDIIGVEHYTFTTTGTSGVHKAGAVGAVFIDASSGIAALTNPPSGAMAFDKSLNQLVYYDGATNDWIGIGSTATDWSFVSVALSSDLDIGAGGTLLFDQIVYDTREEYDPSTGRFTAKASGYYLVNAQIGNIASGDVLFSTCSAYALPQSDLYTLFGVPSSGALDYACLDTYLPGAAAAAISGDYVRYTYNASYPIQTDYYGLNSDYATTASLTASTESGANVATRMIDRNTSTYWSGDTLLPKIPDWTTQDWCKFDLGVHRVISSIIIRPRDDGTYKRLKDFKFAATNLSMASDPELWDILYTGICSSSTNTTEFYIPNTKPYRWYAIIMYSQRDPDVAGNRGQISEIYMYGPPWAIPDDSTNISMFFGTALSADLPSNGSAPVSASLAYATGTSLYTSGSTDLKTWAITDESWSFWPSTVYHGIDYSASTGKLYFTPASANAACAMGLSVEISPDNGCAAGDRVFVGAAYLGFQWNPPTPVARLQLKKNGTVVAARSIPYWYVAPTDGSGLQTMRITHTVYLVPGDYVELYTAVDSVDLVDAYNVSQSQEATGDPAVTYMTIAKIDGAGI